MFPDHVVAILQELERRDAIDSVDDTPKEQRVRCVTPAVARLLYTLVLIRRPAVTLELGTSVGYSTIYLAAAARLVGGRVVSIDSDADKVAGASANLDRAGLRPIVDLRLGSALEVIADEAGPFDFVFMDHAARLYLDSFLALRSKLSAGAVIVADGWGTVERWRTEPALARYAEAVDADPEFETFLLPLEKGELIAVRR